MSTVSSSYRNNDRKQIDVLDKTGHLRLQTLLVMLTAWFSAKVHKRFTPTKPLDLKRDWNHLKFLWVTKGYKIAVEQLVMWTIDFPISVALESIVMDHNVLQGSEVNRFESSLKVLKLSLVWSCKVHHRTQWETLIIGHTMYPLKKVQKPMHPRLTNEYFRL